MSKQQLRLWGMAIGLVSYIVIGLGTEWWVALAVVGALWGNNMERSARDSS